MAGRASILGSLPVFACLLGALTLALVLLGRYYGLGDATFALLAVPVVLAIGYLLWYRTLPYERPRPRARVAEPLDEDAASDTEEPAEETFEDPVEEADRIEAGLDDPEAPESSPSVLDADDPDRPPPVSGR